MDNTTELTSPEDVADTQHMEDDKRNRGVSFGENEMLTMQEQFGKRDKLEPKENERAEQVIDDLIRKEESQKDEVKELEEFVFILDEDEISLTDIFKVDGSQEGERSEDEVKSDKKIEETADTTISGATATTSPLLPLVTDLPRMSVTTSKTAILDNITAAPLQRQEEVPIDRHLYYQLHKMYKEQYEKEKQKNNILQTKLGFYFQKKRMFHVLLTSQNAQIPSDYQKKYDKLLDELEGMSEESMKEEMRLKSEIENLKRHYYTKKEELNSLLTNFRKKKRDFVRDLIHASDEDHKANTERVLSKHLEQQERQGENLRTVRLAYIKLKNKYDETQRQLETSDVLGSKFHLMDYEQLKVDNTNLRDKLEEKEVMLTTIRKQCQHAAQILAHNREKLSALEDDIQKHKDDLETITGDWADAREQLQYLKDEKAHYRRLSNKLKTKAGLLIKPKLLKDMEKSMKELKEGWLKMEEYKDHFHTVSGLVATLRKSISSLKNQRIPLKQ